MSVASLGVFGLGFLRFRVARALVLGSNILSRSCPKVDSAYLP